MSYREPTGPYAEAVLASKPMAYWRLDDIEGPTALDSTGHGRHARYEGGVALLPAGAGCRRSLRTASRSTAPSISPEAVSRPSSTASPETYSVELWFWNGLPTDIRPITGHLLSFGVDRAGSPPHDNIGIGGANVGPGRLFVSSGGVTPTIFAGKTKVEPKTWHHLALVRQHGQIFIHLDGNPEPEISCKAEVDPNRRPELLFVGGLGDGHTNFEGKIDEVALFGRPLSIEEIAEHVHASRNRGETTPVTIP